MKIKELLEQIKKKCTAKKIIKALTALTIFLWLIMYIYLLSNKSSSPIFCYETELLERKSILTALANKEASKNAESLAQLYKEICQINLGLNDFITSTKYLNALVNLSNRRPNYVSQLDWDVFVGNIYRDFDNCEQAKLKYIDSLAILNSNRFQKEENNYVVKAKILNNIGTTYFLQAQNAGNKSECRQDYFLAKEYFDKAAHILGIKNDCLSKTIQNNLEQCAAEIAFF